MNTPTRLLSLTIATLLASAVAHGAAHERDAFIKQYDTNHDGKVTRAEFNAAREQRFNATDTDHNGTLDEGEYLAEYVGQLDAELATSGQSEAEKTATRQRQLKQLLVRFDVLDTDHGQHISRAEYDDSGTRSFNRHDSDKDDAVTVNDAVDDSTGRQATTP